jgi:hypothetical protein
VSYVTGKVLGEQRLRCETWGVVTKIRVLGVRTGKRVFKGLYTPAKTLKLTNLTNTRTQAKKENSGNGCKSTYQRNHVTTSVCLYIYIYKILNKNKDLRVPPPRENADTLDDTFTWFRLQAPG